MRDFGKIARDEWGSSDVSFDDYPAPFRWFGYGFWIFGILGFPIYHTIDFLATGWLNLPIILSTAKGKIGCSVAVVISGLVLYLIRKKHRFFYASLELSVAAVTAFYASEQLPENEDRFKWLLSIVGALYLSVRAFENFSKWKTEAILDTNEAMTTKADAEQFANHRDSSSTDQNRIIDQTKIGTTCVSEKFKSPRSDSEISPNSNNLKHY